MTIFARLELILGALESYPSVFRDETTLELCMWRTKLKDLVYEERFKNGTTDCLVHVYF